MGTYAESDTCVMCGAYVPEGAQVCPCCMESAGENQEKEGRGWSPSHTTTTTGFLNFLRR